MSLNRYTQEKQTALFESTGAFFAFSNDQLAGQKKDGITYVSLGSGLIVPKDNAKTLIDGLEKITAEGIKQDLAENGKEAIIRRELFNNECFYTGDISDCVAALSDYGISPSEIAEAYQRIRKTEYIEM